MFQRSLLVKPINSKIQTGVAEFAHINNQLNPGVKHQYSHVNRYIYVKTPRPGVQLLI